MTLRSTLPWCALAVAIVLAAPARAEPAPSGPIQLDSHGVICELRPQGSRPAPGTVSGILNLIDQARDIDVVTNTVPAELGLSFGVRAMLADDAPAMMVDVVVTHPPMGPAGQTVETWGTTLLPGDMALNVFTFEAEWELVQGPWRFQLHQNGEVLLDQGFMVTPPGTVPAVQAACHGAMILSLAVPTPHGATLPQP
jgi:hypothetical protein